MALSLDTKQIILLDPDVTVRLQTEGILQRAGFRVSSYADLASAALPLQKRQHDVVVTVFLGRHVRVDP